MEFWYYVFRFQHLPVINTITVHCYTALLVTIVVKVPRDPASGIAVGFSVRSVSKTTTAMAESKTVKSILLTASVLLAGSFKDKPSSC